MLHLTLSEFSGRFLALAIGVVVGSISLVLTGAKGGRSGRDQDRTVGAIAL